MPTSRLPVLAIVFAAASLSSACASTRVAGHGASHVTRAPYGRTPAGENVEMFTMVNSHGVEVRAITYGAIITHLFAPDRTGQRADIVLGHDSLGGYIANSPYFGAVVGRYGNRIAAGHFTLDGATYTLATNNGPNSLHGGNRGFDKVVWSAAPFESDSGVGVIFSYTSRDGEEGYPGTLQSRVTYRLTESNQLVVDYHATTDKATPVNLTQHSYWNLSGDARRDILGHTLSIDADGITPVDSTLITTGEIMRVAGTPFDFRTATAIGARIDTPNDVQLRYGKGYDHNWVLVRRSASGLEHAARLVDPSSGRSLDVATTEPGLQFYSGNFLDGTVVGKSGKAYPHRWAVALETQHYPDSPNHPNFPSTILRPGQELTSRTVFTFGVAR